MRAFEEDLRALINRHSKEGESDTPDFILASYLLGQLRVFAEAMRERDRWYGRGQAAQPPEHCDKCGEPHGGLVCPYAQPEPEAHLGSVLAPKFTPAHFTDILEPEPTCITALKEDCQVHGCPLHDPQKPKCATCGGTQKTLCVAVEGPAGHSVVQPCPDCAPKDDARPKPRCWTHGRDYAICTSACTYEKLPDPPEVDARDACSSCGHLRARHSTHSEPGPDGVWPRTCLDCGCTARYPRPDGRPVLHFKDDAREEWNEAALERLERDQPDGLKLEEDAHDCAKLEEDLAWSKECSAKALALLQKARKRYGSVAYAQWPTEMHAIDCAIRALEDT